ncbi:MAG TPA: NAD(P)-binding protein, partial [Burkholderiaceae bacterium]|nr:NAD(P)-binding protein [Burkholderiaceae bacterium]
MNTTTTQPSRATAAPSANPGVQRVDVLIVGGGFGGMYAVYRFREMGLRVQAFEAGGDLGG